MTQHRISSQMHFLGSNCSKSSEAGHSGLGCHGPGWLYKELALELGFERSADLPDSNSLSLQ